VSPLSQSTMEKGRLSQISLLHVATLGFEKDIIDEKRQDLKGDICEDHRPDRLRLCTDHTHF
jgi:hypothetical protein